jgi:uncharacterized Zn-finger protein
MPCEVIQINAAVVDLVQLPLQCRQAVNKYGHNHVMVNIGKIACPKTNRVANTRGDRFREIFVA